MKKILITYPEPIVTHDEVFTARNQEPKQRETVSHGKPIEKYPIEEAKFDENGETIPQVDPPFYQVTGQTLEWSIAPGESLRFPEYVAKVLKKRYDFLEIDEGMDETGEMEKTEMKEVKSEPKPEPVHTSGVSVTDAKAKDGGASCKYCGLHFGSMRGLGLHTAIKHADTLL